MEISCLLPPRRRPPSLELDCIVDALGLCCDADDDPDGIGSSVGRASDAEGVLDSFVALLPISAVSLCHIVFAYLTY